MDLQVKDLLEVVCWKKQNILNLIISRKLSLLSGCMKFLLKELPDVVSFKNKSAFFYKTIKKEYEMEFPEAVFQPLRRDHLFEDSYNVLKFKTKD